VEALGPAGICRILDHADDRRAVARTVFGFYDGELRVFAGETAGRIAEAPAGTGGFGWDSIFIPTGSSRTFAEMNAEEKCAFSMRRRALTVLQRELLG
jgi:non-canonical purine NTP pyrophosphatase (RdgB/HAM1 family)